MAKRARDGPEVGTVELAGPFVIGLVAMLLVLVLPIDSDSTLWRVGSQEVGPNQLPAWLAAATGLILGVRHMRAVHKATEDGPSDEVRVASIVGSALIGVVYGAFAGFWGIVAGYVVGIVVEVLWSALTSLV